MRMVSTRRSQLEVSTEPAQITGAAPAWRADSGPAGRNVRSIAKSRSTLGPGIYVFGIGGIVLGLIGLVWGDFSTDWQHIGPKVPFREVLAYITAICELLAGSAMLWRRTARMGAAVLTVFFGIFTLLWVPDIFKAPGVYDGWGNFFEELSGFLGGLVAFALLSPGDSPWRARAGIISRVYGICPVSFGLVHIISFKPVVEWIPKWIPPGQVFWAVATTVFFFMAAGAILFGILGGLAARLLTAQIVGFEILVWMPKMFTAPHEHFTWAGNAISIELAAAAWVVSDAICGIRGKRAEAEEGS